MELVYHILVGFHLSGLRRLRVLAPGLRLPLVVAAAALPDLDRLLPAVLRFGFWGKVGPLHSLVGAAAASLLLWSLVAPWLPRPQRRAAAAAIGLGVGAHLCLDALTIWGPPLAWPLRHEPLALGWVHERDGWVLFLLGAPLAYRWIRGSFGSRRPLGRTGPSVAVFLALYVAICGAAKGRALRAAVHALDGGDGHFEAVRAYPAPYGPLLWTTAVRTDRQRWVRGVASAALGGVTRLESQPTGEADPRMQVALGTPRGARYRQGADALFLAQVSDLEEDGSFEVALGDLRFSDPFSDRLPWVLWLRIGPDFSHQDWRFVAAPDPEP